MTSSTPDYTNSPPPKAHESARPPALLLHIELERPARFRLEAEGCDDEMRLRTWLRGSSALRDLAADVARLLDELDEAA